MTRTRNSSLSGAAILTISWLIAAALVLITMMTGCEGAYTIAPEEVATWHQGVDQTEPNPPCYEQDSETGTVTPCDNSSVPSDSDSTTTPEPDPAPNGAAGR